MSVVIKVENLSKQYRLGEVGTGSLKDDFKRFRYGLLGKEDPFLKIGETNDRNTKSESDYVWALQDINFEVNHGDVVGIIGRNGAGKSTLLKLLSRTTSPTSGSVKIKGRVASLLEVGTGFHGELSGRDNIYLNGAIMGLNKREIAKKLDEIIAFAGVDRYLDTPVKRYSSGMYVRLAFAVAAHLEPDILIVDEVLAVGDAEFQKKCLGKMKEVSLHGGRTVLFVSHNITAINNLCKSAMLLVDGTVKLIGKTNDVIDKYVETANSKGQSYYDRVISENQKLCFNKIYLTNLENIITSSFEINDSISINFEISNQISSLFMIGVAITDKYERRVLIDVFEYETANKNNLVNVKAQVPVGILTPGVYKLEFSLYTHHEFSEFISDIIEFEISKENTKYETITYDFGVINKGLIWNL